MTISTASIGHRRRWKHLAATVATSCATATTSIHAFCNAGPLHHRRSAALCLSAVVEQPTCRQLEGDRMFYNLQKNSNNILITPPTERYGGHAAAASSSNDDDTKDKGSDRMLGFYLDEDGLILQDSSKQQQEDFENSPIKNQLASRIWRRRETSLLPAWFPWLPTRSQIQMLKVTELKEACMERSLKKTGNKAALQARLWEWTSRQHKKRIAQASGGSVLGTAMDMRLPLQDMYTNSSGRKTRVPRSQPSGRDAYFRSPRTTKPNRNNVRNENGLVGSNDKRGSNISPGQSKKQLEQKGDGPDSLADWARNLDLEPLLNRRRAIRREAQEGKRKKQKPRQNLSSKKVTPGDLSTLTDAFEAPPSLYSNLEVKQMYMAAKEADQTGDRVLSKQLLLKLKEATPNDARIFRRLARMESEDGRVDEARKWLQEGLRLHPNNGFLWHGLGQLELKAHNDEEARRCFQKAIAADPSLAHPYHALGTMEHTHGNIAAAMKLFKEGIRYSPTNHRLHHALGDLYREAKMLEMAETSYRRSLEYGNLVNHGFAYTALAYVAYEKGSVDECRNWLQEAVSLNHGRNSRSWVAWGQMEEAEGNIDAARAVYVEALARYENGLIRRNSNRRNQRQSRHATSNSAAFNPHKANPTRLDNSKGTTLSSLRTKLLQRVPSYRSGDKFINVYRNWARLEERYGDENTVNEVYTRATTAFPRDYQLVLKWAQYHGNNGRVDRARTLFQEACRKVSNWHADPYREYGEFEMSLGNYVEARSILYRGSQAMSLSSDGGLGNRGGMAQLFHTWAVCEWYLDNLSRAEVLFDHALRLTDGGQDGSEIRSYILYSIARLEYFHGEYELAQHCVALCLKENVMPGGNSRTWLLWADVATAMGNDSLAKECKRQAEIVRKDEENGGVESLSRFLGLARPGTSSPSSANSRGPAMQHLMRRDPWNHKIFGPNKMFGGFSGLKLPDMPQTGANVDPSLADVEE